MIKLKRFLEDPLGAYNTYTKEHKSQNQKLIDENTNLKRQLKSLEKHNKKLQKELSELKNVDRDWDKVVRTMYWYFTGLKMKKGHEYNFVMKIKEGNDE